MSSYGRNQVVRLNETLRRSSFSEAAFQSLEMPLIVQVAGLCDISPIRARGVVVDRSSRQFHHLEHIR
ncbi:hypothetical protein D3C85_506890 [compost metagenome]